ncbi:uncharacterized protein VICG_00270, partial [Vittaforma corneae ATCC 50505]
MEKVTNSLVETIVNEQKIKLYNTQNSSNVQINVELNSYLNCNETNDDRLSKIKKRMIFMTKVILFIICCYAVTPYSNNPKQREYKHTYSDLKFLYFTNQSLYFTVLTVAVGFIYRLKPRLFEFYNTLLPVALTFEIVVTGVFWSLYFVDKKLIVNTNFLKPGYETPILTELGLHLFPLILLILDQVDVKLRQTRLQSWFMTCYLAL